MTHDLNLRQDVERPGRFSRHWAAMRTLLLLLVLAGAGSVSSPVRAAEDGQYKTTDGIGVYYGILPAEIVKGHPGGHPEAAMHGGLPPGHQVHLIVALFDAATSARIENAKVSAAVSPLGIPRLSQPLDPMQIAGTVTYGGFFPLARGDRYVVDVKIERPGALRPIEVEFSYDHPLP